MWSHLIFLLSVLLPSYPATPAPRPPQLRLPGLVAVTVASSLSTRLPDAPVTTASPKLPLLPREDSDHVGYYFDGDWKSASCESHLYFTTYYDYGYCCLDSDSCYYVTTCDGGYPAGPVYTYTCYDGYTCGTAYLLQSIGATSSTTLVTCLAYGADIETLYRVTTEDTPITTTTRLTSDSGTTTATTTTEPTPEAQGGGGGGLTRSDKIALGVGIPAAVAAIFTIVGVCLCRR